MCANDCSLASFIYFVYGSVEAAYASDEWMGEQGICCDYRWMDQQGLRLRGGAQRFFLKQSNGCIDNPTGFRIFSIKLAMLFEGSFKLNNFICIYSEF